MTFSLQGLTYRLFSCALCATLVLICNKCDYGHRYCSKEHSKEGRRQKHAKAQADYQREHHATWKNAHRTDQKNYRDRESERAQAAQSAAVHAAADVGCAVPAPQPVVAVDDLQSAASSSSAPEKNVAMGSLSRQMQSHETPNVVTVIRPEQITEKGSVTVARTVPTEHLVEHVTSGVTDHTLERLKTPVKVSVQGLPATEDTGERPIEARFPHKPMCCKLCERVLEPTAGFHTWPKGG